MNVAEVLVERGSRYGDFMENARITQGCMDLLLSGQSAGDLTASQKEAIHMIIHKLSRMVNGDVNYRDNVVDLMGYAQLMLDDMPK